MATLTLPLTRMRSTTTARRYHAAFFVVTLVVFVTQLGFALWMNSRDYLWGDAESRATSGLIALYAAHPHLAAIGFVWMPLPTFLELIPVAFYPAWSAVVSSGFSASLIT